MVIRACEDLSVWRALERCDIAGVASEHAHGCTTIDVPHTDILVAASEDVSAVWMEATYIDVTVMANKNAESGDIVSVPEACNFVVTARKEVVAMR